MKKLFSLLVSVALVLSLCVGVSTASSIPTELGDICTQQEWEVLKLTNRERLANGLAPYSIFPALQSAAGVREQELISLYSHSRPDGSKCFTVLKDITYRSAAENIAVGPSSARSVVQSWLNSEDHKTNIMDKNFTHMGAGYTSQSCTIMTETGTGRIRNGWVQLFLGGDCVITGISLSEQTVSCYAGSSLDSLNLYVKATCSVHGDCYLPLLSGMYSTFNPNAVGTQTLTVTYSGQTAQLQVEVISVSEPDIDSDSGSGSSGGGSFGGGSSSLDTSSAESWAVNWLKRADALNLLSNRNRAQFTADVTRLQFADLAVTLAEQLTGNTIVPVADNAFTDTTEIMILKAKAAGIAGGYEVNGSYEFRPENPISRQEICVMLAHVVDYVTAHQDIPTQLDRSETINGSFPDAGQVADWAVKQVALMTNNNIMGGKATDTGAIISPNANTTLQEAVTLIVKLYDILH